MNQKEKEILMTFAQIPYLTGNQVANLGIYSPTSKTAVLALLKSLTEGSVLHRDRSHINEPYVYWLAARGREILRNNGVDFTSWPYPSEMKDALSSPSFSHLLGINEFLVCAKALQRLYPQINYCRFYHEFILRRILKPVREKDYYPPIPDAYIRFGQEWERDKPAFWVEWDMGTEEPNQIEAKTKRIADLIRNHWKDFADIPVSNFYFVFITPISDERAKQLMYVVKNELFHQSLKHLAENGNFKFAYLPKLEPKNVFEEAVWYKPYVNGKVCLFEI